MHDPATLHAADLTEIRQYLHARPELSGNEYHTADLIARCLEPLRPRRLLRGLGGTGVLAQFSSEQPGPHVLLRAELDALPIQEANDFPHRSRHDGISHKCGHDGHMTALLGVARLLAVRPPERGIVSLLFQPAEETGAGAAAVAGDAEFADIRPDWVFAFHNLPGRPFGEVVLRSGTFNAAVRSLIIRLQGKTAHAAEPENGINPAATLASIVQEAAALAQADTARPDFALLTPVHMLLGEPAYGVSAGYGEIHLTLRTWTETDMERLAEQLLSRAANLAREAGLQMELSWTDVFRASNNDPGATGLVQAAALAEGLAVFVPPAAMKWGEDFGLFTQRFRGAMFGIGAGEAHPALHHADYDYPDQLNEVAVRLWRRLVELALAERAYRLETP